METKTAIASKQRISSNALVLHTCANKKLSYHRGTARRAVLGSSCYVSQGMGVRKVSISKWPSRSFKGIGNGAIQ